MNTISPPPGVPWFHMRTLPEAGAAAWLPRDEARHATGSKRLSPGDEIVLFDGCGGAAVSRLGADRSRDGSLAVTVERRLECEPLPSVTVATAVPKGDRWSTLLDMLGQLGATRIVPLDCERSVVAAEQVRRERAERILVEACKQARRAWSPILAGPSTPLEVVRRALDPAATPGGRAALAHPGGAPLAALRDAGDPSAPMTILVGPEGGFTEREVDECRAAGATLASLGDGILRVETACVTALALWRCGRPAPKWSVPGSNR